MLIILASIKPKGKKEKEREQTFDTELTHTFNDTSGMNTTNISELNTTKIDTSGRFRTSSHAIKYS
jgi:hypothetical protein